MPELRVRDRPLFSEEVPVHMTADSRFPGVPYQQPPGAPLGVPTTHVAPPLHHQPTPRLVPAPPVCDLQHSVLHYAKHWYCGHPRQGIFAYFGKGEIVVGHNHAPCCYETPADVAHDLGGYHSRAVMLLQRSLDGGCTWPESEDVVVYDETMTTERKRAFLYQPDAVREPYDMFRPESLFFFGRTYLPEDRGGTALCFALRSPDKGRTWEQTPTIVRHPNGDTVWVHKDCHPVVRMPDGKTLLAGMTIAGSAGPGIYSSRDNGLTWEFLSRVGTDRSGSGRFTYMGLLLIPDGTLQCYALQISGHSDQVAGTANAICRFVSSDGGTTWSDPTPIVGQGAGCWRNPGTEGHAYRSPWPILLRDERILVAFARRRAPMGIGAVLSSDGGQTWSEEFVIRDDGSHPDLGYPVGCELDDGRIFLAYYFTMPDGNALGGMRYLAGSTFRIG